jgi:hypothetical protein
MKYKIKRISTFKWGPEIDGKRHYEVDNSKITITAGLDRSGNYITGLSESDERRFEKLFGKELLTGYYNNHSNFWCGGELFGSIVEPWTYTHITDTGSDGFDKGVTLDTSIPEEEFKVLVLLAQKQVNTKDRKNSDAVLELESLEDKIDEIVEFRSLKSKAYSIFDQLTEESKRKYYTMLEGKSSKGIVLKTLDFALSNYIEHPTKVKRFIDLVTDTSVDEKFKYQQLVDAKVIEKYGNKFIYEGKELGKNLHEVYLFLNQKNNSELRSALMKQYLASYEEVV